MTRNLFDISLFVFPVLLLYLLIRFSLVKNIKIEFMKDILRTTFVVYISSLIFIVWVTGSYYSDHLIYNFIPLKTIIKYLKSGSTAIALKNIIGNIIITVPLGFFTYFKIRVFPRTSIFLYSLLIPFIIELVQFLLFIQRITTRTVDIDDIILNSLGILLGYFFTRLFFNKKQKRQVSTI